MRYLLLSFGVLLLLIFGIVIFTRSNDQPALPGKNLNLVSYATNLNNQVRYTIDGPINAPEDHRAIRITVSPTSRSLEVISGYNGAVTTSQSYTNDVKSYSNFLAALQRADFTKQRTASTANYQSICPLGNRNTYEVINNGHDAMKLWSADCATGSFAGNLALTADLFQTQIPDYGTLTNDVTVTGTPSLHLL